MVSGRPPIDIEELFKPTTTAGVSWYDILDNDDAKAFLDVLLERAVEAGRKPNIAQTARVLDEHWGVTVSHSTLKKLFDRRIRDGSS